MSTGEEERVRLAIPLLDAVAFAMGWSNLSYEEPDDGLRQVMGLLAIDALEYSEHWRAAAQLRESLHHRWPEWGIF